MKILSENRRIVSYVGLGADNRVRIFGNSISRHIVGILFGCALLLGILLSGLLILRKYSDGPTAVLYPFCLLLSFVSSTLVYTSLMQKRAQIVELFDYLQVVVDQSNAFRIGKPLLPKLLN